MFKESAKAALLNIKETLKTEYISFFNDGTITEDNGEYVLSSMNDGLNGTCSYIDRFLKDGTRAMTLLSSADYDELNFTFKMGIIYNQNTLGNNNQILPTSKYLNDKVRYYTDAVEAYKDGVLVATIQSNEMMGYQGFTDYNKLVKSCKKEGITLMGPNSFEELKDIVTNNRQEKISLLVDFKKELDKTEEVNKEIEVSQEITTLENKELKDIKSKNNSKIKRRSLFRK